MSNQDSVMQQNTCESVAYIPLTVSIPISLEPCIRKLPISAKPCGEPELMPTPWGTYIMTQNLCVRVPMEIDIESKIGHTHTHCEKPNPFEHTNWGSPNVVIGTNGPC